jgi:hypothetical protein
VRSLTFRERALKPEVPSEWWLIARRLRRALPRLHGSGGERRVNITLRQVPTNQTCARRLSLRHESFGGHSRVYGHSLVDYALIAALIAVSH